MRSLYSSHHDWLHPACKVLQKNKIQALSPHSWWCDWWLSHGEKLPEMLGSSITSWMGGSSELQGFDWPVCLSMARHSEIWLGWTESALAVTTASLWVAFANPASSWNVLKMWLWSLSTLLMSCYASSWAASGPDAAQEHACAAQNAMVNKQYCSSPPIGALHLKCH